MGVFISRFICMGESVLAEKSKLFAVKIIKFYQYLMEKQQWDIGRQVLRSGTSIGANIRESKNAQSRADFINKLSIALKEADETQYWFEILYESEIIRLETFEDMNKDIKELIAMLISSINTLKKGNEIKLKKEM